MDRMDVSQDLSQDETEVVEKVAQALIDGLVLAKENYYATQRLSYMLNGLTYVYPEAAMPPIKRWVEQKHPEAGEQ